jgi:hypothetical protein
MAVIFLSYRRTDSPQACRVHDWLALRFGNDAVFMDVAAIPFAVNFPDFIRTAIQGSSLMILLIGSEWHARIQQPDDPVRMEVEAALAAGVPVLPVLIGTTRMPGPETLPVSIRAIATQNAAFVGVLNDFETHMRALLPKIESMLGALAARSVVTADPHLISDSCNGVVRFLADTIRSERGLYYQWEVFGTSDFHKMHQNTASLYLHRISQLGDLLELHVLISFWTESGDSSLEMAGLVMQRLEQDPVIPYHNYTPQTRLPVQVKVRRSDEDPRQVWKMITDYPLRLSLAYVVTVSPGPVVGVETPHA